MLEITDFQRSEKNSELKMEERYLIFDRRLGEIERDLALTPYPKISEIKEWAEKVLMYLNKVKLMREQSILLSKNDWSSLIQKIFKYATENKKTISVFSNYVMFIVRLEQRYRQRLYVFLNYLDSCVGYLKSYTKDLEEQGFSLSGILAESEQLSEMNWLSAMN